MNNIKYTFLW